MRFLVYLLYCTTCFCQTTIVKNNIDEFIGVDIYENIYYTQNNTLYKSGITNNYCNIKYGVPDQIDISNPFQILIFYKTFNNVVLLDNKLNYLSEFQLPIGVSLIANAGKDQIWMYNNFTTTLSRYNYKTQKTEAKSLPNLINVKKLKSNLNYAFVLRENKNLETYNFIARKIHQKNTQNTKLPISLNSVFFYKDKKIYTNNNCIFISSTPVNSFEIINNTCYYLNENTIYTTPVSKK